MADLLVPSAYATIQAALNAASSNDRILLASGTYTEADLVWPAGRPSGVFIGPQSGATVILAPSSATTAIIKVEIAGGGLAVADATIQGLQMKAPSGKYCVSGSNSSGLTLREVTCPSDHVGSFLTTGGTDTLVDACNVLKCDQGIRRSAGSGLTVRNSTLRLDVSGGGKIGVETYHATDSFENSLVVVGSNSTATAWRFNHGATARNCVAVKEGAAGGTGFYLGHADADVDFCTANGFTTNFDEASASKGADCSTDAPSFVDAGSLDYQSAKTSCLVDTGTTLAAVTTDMLGVTRPKGTAYDRGPYEYVRSAETYFDEDYEHIPDPYGDYVVGAPIRVSSASPDHGGVDRLGRNANTYRAAWAPSIVTQHAQDYDGSGGRSLSFMSESDTSFTLRYAMRFLVDPDGLAQVLAAVRARTEDSGAEGAVKVTSVEAADDDTAVVNSDAWAWYRGLALDTVGDATGREIVGFWLQMTSGTGDLQLRSLEAHFAPYEDADDLLPTGVYASGFVAIDDAQTEADAPLSSGLLLQLADNHEALRAELPLPVGAILYDLTLTGKNAQCSTVAQEFAKYDAGPILWWPRPGAGVQELSVSVLGYAETSGEVRVVARWNGQTVASTAVSLGAGAPDPEDPSDWLDVELDVSAVPESSRQPVELYAMLKSGVVGEAAVLYSMCVQELP